MNRFSELLLGSSIDPVSCRSFFFTNLRGVAKKTASTPMMAEMKMFPIVLDSDILHNYRQFFNKKSWIFVKKIRNNL